jgi:hypothetical protein
MRWPWNCLLSGNRITRSLSGGQTLWRNQWRSVTIYIVFINIAKFKTRNMKIILWWSTVCSPSLNRHTVGFSGVQSSTPCSPKNKCKWIHITVLTGVQSTNEAAYSGCLALYCYKMKHYISEMKASIKLCTTSFSVSNLPLLPLCHYHVLGACARL